ncbi:MAG: hypothetical protein AW07_04171 [Candidatus Accumulibacter sp. SK-11]|nr:MAG: hypothetical protein AW07_04171 [Candidatus Accumulibacter sp. SK-11]
MLAVPMLRVSASVIVAVSRMWICPLARATNASRLSRLKAIASVLLPVAGAAVLPACA